MKKFDGFLFCTDLDGTLYDDNKKISRENLKAIEYFKSEGGLFTFITGRIPALSREVCDLIRPNAPFGCLNGGGIYDPQTDKFLWNLSLSDDVIELVREVDRQLPDIGIQYNTEKTAYFNKNNAETARFRERTGLPNIVCHYEDVKETVLKILFIHDRDEQILAVANILNNHSLADRFDFIRSEETIYEILPKGASKGAVLYKMAEFPGVDIRKTVAVGDYNNDISMIKAAGIGFAVANAVDEAKAVADYVTASNNDHAIAAIVDGLDKGTYTMRN